MTDRAVRPHSARRRGRHDATILTPAQADRVALDVLELAHRLARIAEGLAPRPELDAPSSPATLAALPAEVLYARVPEYRPTNQRRS